MRTVEVSRRADIQWLRALAVTLVVVYHLAPGALPGGYVGVDVFFVISGFLITQGLIRRPPASLRDLGGFWARRIRRLFPASFSVIAATGLTMWLFGPPSQWRMTAQDAVASTAYAQNLNLWHRGVDYLQAGSTPSVYQHFWSLSLEEQFYIFWPILILAVVRLTRNHRPPPPALITIISSVFVISLALSIWLTPTHPTAAYFSTPSRVWELALGGLIAIAHPLTTVVLKERPWPSLALSALGVSAVVGAAALFDGATPFPGSLALIPTLGAAAFIIGGISLQNTVSRGPVPLTERFLAARPFQWVGDASYSIYLWHWPIFLILPYVFGHSFDGPATAIPVALTLVLSALSHRFIEEPLRRSNDRIQPLHRAFIFALLGSIIIGGTGGSAYQMIPRLAAHQLQTAQTLIAANPCAGAAALLDSQCATQRPGSTGDSLLLPPLAAAFDLSNVYVRNCRWTPGMTEFPVCEYGVTPDPQSIEIALVGNSHAVQWLPALEILAPDLHLHITTHLANGCFLGSIKLNYSDPNDVALCQQFTSVTMNRILESRPDLVVISGLSDYSGLIFQDVTQSFESVLKNLTDANIDVLAISDSPRPDPPMSIPECVSMNEHDLSKCDGPRETWLHPDPIIVAANNIGEPSIATVDLTDGFCDEKTCHGVVGGIIVYFDDDHVTTSFARTLAPYLQPAIVAALEQTFS